LLVPGASGRAIFGIVMGGIGTIALVLLLIAFVVNELTRR
jgi:hypothetical protein